MPRVYAIDGIVPVVEPSAFVHPSAVLSGDVIVAARAYIGPCASLRGDFGRIVVEEGANIQDGCMLHGFPGKNTIAGAEATVGHGAILHGCVVRRGALIGMNCVINDNAEIGEDAVVAALAFVKAEARIPARSLAAGIPARAARALGGGDPLEAGQHGALPATRRAQRHDHERGRGPHARRGGPLAHRDSRFRAAFRVEEEAWLSSSP